MVFKIEAKELSNIVIKTLPNISDGVQMSLAQLGEITTFVAKFLLRFFSNRRSD
jgi:hypothetical protein